MPVVTAGFQADISQKSLEEQIISSGKTEHVLIILEAKMVFRNSF